jgi:4-hydroxy-3-polyprenylbenzoate decarboxylase
MASERLFLPLLQMTLPEVVDYHLPPEGVFHNLALVAIRKTYPGQAFKVMNALWGQGQMMFAKMIVVVDEGIDLRNHQEVWWYALSNLDPSRDLLTSKGPADALDHACAVPFIHGKIGLDGTRKIAGESSAQPWPQALDLPPELKSAARAKLEKWLGMNF